MEYMLFICADPDYEPPEEDTRAAHGDTVSWVDEMDARGIRKQGDRLRFPADATTVTVRAGETLVTDGPFAETKEFICGYDLIECDDLDTAIEVAAKHPMARMGLVEIRPLWPIDD